MTPSQAQSRSFGRRSDLHKITIVHGDRVRDFHVDTRMAAGLAAVAGAFALAFLGATGVFFVRDDLLADQLGRQVRAERAYEDRVAALRAEIDRINARQLVDQDAFEAKIDQLMARQTRLGETQAKFAGLVAKVGELGIALPTSKGPAIAPIGSPLPPTGATPAVVPLGTPAPASETPSPLDLDRFATPLRTSWFSGVGRAQAAEGRDPAHRIAAAEHALADVEHRQSAAASGLAALAEGRRTTWNKALQRIGFKVAERPRAATQPADGVGGPFVPAEGDAISRAEAALARLADIRSVARRLPLARPMDGDRTITSEFGNRTDPFLGVGAIHTGIDFRAETGEPIRATGPGTVISAGRQGGYGLAVDVDHGNGVVTRYGHMSSLSVAPGEKLKTGDVVGLAGSTGRSTGPHLHYETRVAGDAVDPRDWLEAGKALGF